MLPSESLQANIRARVRVSTCRAGKRLQANWNHATLLFATRFNLDLIDENYRRWEKNPDVG